MEITLSRENQKLIEDRLRRGQFRSADEMIGRALRLLEEQEQELAREKGEIRALRDERWKLIRYPHINHTQLFDLKDDPHEVRDLSDEASRRETADRLLGLMRQWQKRLGDGCPLTSEKPRPAAFTPP